jgi:hypothetical protein
MANLLLLQRTFGRSCPLCRLLLLVVQEATVTFQLLRHAFNNAKIMTHLDALLLFSGFLLHAPSVFIPFNLLLLGLVAHRRNFKFQRFDAFLRLQCVICRISTTESTSVLGLSRTRRGEMDMARVIADGVCERWLALSKTRSGVRGGAIAVLDPGRMMGEGDADGERRGIGGCRLAYG